MGNRESNKTNLLAFPGPSGRFSVFDHPSLFLKSDLIDNEGFFHYALSLYPSSSMTMRAQQILEAHAHVVFRLCACHNLCHVFFSFHSLLPLIIVTTSSPSSLPLTTPQPIFLSSNFHFIHLLFFFFSH